MLPVLTQVLLLSVLPALSEPQVLSVLTQVLQLSVLPALSELQVPSEPLAHLERIPSVLSQVNLLTEWEPARLAVRLV